MKVSLQRRDVCRRHQDGSAVIVVIVLLGIMLIYIGANLKGLHALRTELKLIETRQVQRVQQVASTTHGDASTNAPNPRTEIPDRSAGYNRSTEPHQRD